MPVTVCGSEIRGQHLESYQGCRHPCLVMSPAGVRPRVSAPATELRAGFSDLQSLGQEWYVSHRKTGVSEVSEGLSAAGCSRSTVCLVPPPGRVSVCIFPSPGMHGMSVCH